MYERDPPAAGPGARHLIDETVAGFPARGERGVEIGDPVADVVDARPPSCQKLGDRAIGVAGRQQLDL